LPALVAFSCDQALSYHQYSWALGYALGKCNNSLDLFWLLNLLYLEMFRGLNSISHPQCSHQSIALSRSLKGADVVEEEEEVLEEELFPCLKL
jgi:hypothetical protein